MSVWHQSAMREQAKNTATPAPVPAPVPTPYIPAPMENYAQLHDHARTILTAAPIADEYIKADAWNAYHGTRSAHELATKLQNIPLPGNIAADLIAAKRSAKFSDAADRIFETLSRIPKSILDIAEQHPQTLRHFTDAVED
jgi:hypothetical protein